MTSGLPQLPGQFLRRWDLLWHTTLLLCLLTVPSEALCGSYLDSAHGSSSNGVFRPVIGNTPPMGLGYARGNCTHCHEQHSSIGGTEPAPVTAPTSHAIFAPNFNTSAQTHPYAERDNFCFYCHNSAASAQVVNNNSYSQNFGCGPQEVNSVLGAMNQLSYHNLYDIWNLSKNKFSSWFKASTNPCDACHNPHLARRNWANAKDPGYSAISKPNDHFKLWGTSETMEESYNTRYEPPFCSSSLTDREPAASADAVSGRANTPDYVSFCTECHNTSDTIYSTTLNTNVRAIDWESTGDKHGLRTMDGGVDIKEPYSTNGDYVLSCADCHEPHGSANVMLIRNRVNGGELEEHITDLNTPDWSFLCKRCHMDDQDATNAGLPFANLGIGSQVTTGAPNKWRYAHHAAPDAPYTGSLPNCNSCHTIPGPPGPIDCAECHYHGAIITISTGENAGTQRRAF